MKLNAVLVTLCCAGIPIWAPAATGPWVTEYWPAAAAFPVSLHGQPVGTETAVTIPLDRDLGAVLGAALELLVDDIDAQREAVITLNGVPVAVSAELLGEGRGPGERGFRGQMELPLTALRRGDNQVTFKFADNLNGSTAGYLVLAANLALRVRESEADLARTRDLGPELADAPDQDVYARGLTGTTPAAEAQVVRETAVAAERSRLGHRGLFRPALVRLGDGRWLACCDYRYEGASWRLKLLRRAAAEPTWTAVETTGAPLLGARPRLTGGSRQRLLLLTAWHQNRLMVYRSIDGGLSWTGSALPEGLRPCREIPETEAGTFEMWVSAGSYYNRAASPARAWIYTSADGLTWARREPVTVWKQPEPPFEQGSLVRLPDGTLVAAGRVTGNMRIPDQVLPHPPAAPLPWMKGSSVPAGDESGDHMILARSRDGGRTWTGFEPLTGYSEVHAQLTVLPDGRLLCTYAQRHLPYGIYAMVSPDGGRTWDPRRRVRLAVSQTAEVGWPESIALADGTVITAYGRRLYLEQDAPDTTVDCVAELVHWQPE